MKKNKVLALLQVESNAATIAEKAGCSTQYVYKHGECPITGKTAHLTAALFNAIARGER